MELPTFISNMTTIKKLFGFGCQIFKDSIPGTYWEWIEQKFGFYSSAVFNIFITRKMGLYQESNYNLSSIFRFIKIFMFKCTFLSPGNLAGPSGGKQSDIIFSILSKIHFMQFIPRSHTYWDMGVAAFLSGLQGWMFGPLGWSSGPAKLVAMPFQLKTGTAAVFTVT